MIHLSLDHDRWHGADIEARLARSFVDIVTVNGFRAFVAERQISDPTAALVGWRRGLDRSGGAVLIAVVTWNGRMKPWRFPLLSFFYDHLDSRGWLVFDADLPRIKLDLGIAMPQPTFICLPTLEDLPIPGGSAP